ETVSQDNCLAARQVLLNDCTTCHTFVPIVMQSFDENGWRGLLTRHVENGRVTQVPPEQIENLRLYLAENFNGDLPPPDLPPALLETWTSYYRGDAGTVRSRSGNLKRADTLAGTCCPIR